MKRLSKPSFILKLLSSLLLLIWLGCGHKEPAPNTRTPVLGAVSVSEVKSTSAKATCTIKDVGFGALATSTIKEYGICYATTESPTTASIKISAGTSATATLDFSATLSGLTAGTKYFVRAYVLHEGDPVYSEQATFTTDNLKGPEVTTADATDLTSTAFSMVGKLTSLGTSDITQFGHVLSATNQTPTTADTKTEMGTANAVPKDFKSVFGSLKPNTTYYVRAYATNATGTGYSEVKTVKTSADQPPTVTSQGVDNVTTNSARALGTVASGGTQPVTQYGHFWSSTNGDPKENDSKTQFGATSAPKDFASTMSNLQPGTTYYVRAYAISNVGTAYGDVKNFKTQDAQPPTVSSPTSGSELAGTTTLSVYGRVDNVGVGGGSITQYGHCWSSTNQNPTTDDNKTTRGSLDSQFIPYGFISNLTGLTPNTTYYIRAYATTAAGTGYSAVRTIKTNAVVPPVISAVKRESELTCSSTNSLLSNVAFYDNPCTGSTPGNAEVKVSFTYESKTETAAKFGICLRPENQSGDPVIDDPKVESGNTFSSLVGGYFSARLNVLDKTGNTKTVNCGACPTGGGVILTPCGNQKATEYIYRNPFALQYTVFLVGGGSKKATSYKYRAYIVMTNGNVYYGPTTTIDAVTVCNGPG